MPVHATLSSSIKQILHFFLSLTITLKESNSFFYGIAFMTKARFLGEVHLKVDVESGSVFNIG